MILDVCGSEIDFNFCDEYDCAKTILALKRDFKLDHRRANEIFRDRIAKNKTFQRTNLYANFIKVSSRENRRKRMMSFLGYSPYDRHNDDLYKFALSVAENDGNLYIIDQDLKDLIQKDYVEYYLEMEYSHNPDFETENRRCDPVKCAVDRMCRYILDNDEGLLGPIYTFQSKVLKDGEDRFRIDDILNSERPRFRIDPDESYDRYVSALRDAKLVRKVDAAYRNLDIEIDGIRYCFWKKEDVKQFLALKLNRRYDSIVLNRIFCLKIVPNVHFRNTRRALIFEYDACRYLRSYRAMKSMNLSYPESDMIDIFARSILKCKDDVDSDDDLASLVREFYDEPNLKVNARFYPKYCKEDDLDVNLIAHYDLLENLVDNNGSIFIDDYALLELTNRFDKFKNASALKNKYQQLISNDEIREKIRKAYASCSYESLF